MGIKHVVYASASDYITKIYANTYTTWDNARNSAGDYVSTDYATLTADDIDDSYDSSGPDYYAHVLNLAFDLSSYGATISECALSINISVNSGSQRLRVSSFAWTDTFTQNNTPNATELAALSHLVTSDWSFNTTGRKSVSFNNQLAGGATRKIIVYPQGLVDGTAPTQINKATVTLADSAGTTNDPFLSFDEPTDGTQTFTNSGAVESWTVPASVSTVYMEAWGGGGAGGGNTAQEPGGGGAGFAKAAVAVTPGETLYIRVGRGGTVSTTTAATRDGVSSRVSRNADGVTSPLVQAGAGQGGNATTAGSGGGNAVGTDGASSGDTTFIGGNGAAAQGGGGTRAGSGGGSSAGYLSDGNNGTAGASNVAGVGGTAPTGGGDGGRGGTSTVAALAGSIPGGGGGGKASTGTGATGQPGARGQVILSWNEDGGGGPANTFRWTIDGFFK